MGPRQEPVVGCATGLAEDLRPPLRIAHVFQGALFLGPERAAEVHVTHTMDALERAGHMVELVLPWSRRKVVRTRRPHSLATTGPRSDELCPTPFTGSGAYRALEGAVRRGQDLARLPYLALFDSHRMSEACRHCLGDVDLVHERYNSMALGALHASRRLGLPYVLEVNADVTEEIAQLDGGARGISLPALRRAFRHSLHAATEVICVSERLARHLENRWDVAAGRIHVIPNAVDVDRFAADVGTRDDVQRRELGYGPEQIVVMFVGGFFPWHDLRLLVRGFATAVERDERLRLLLVGDGPEMPQVERLVEQLSIQSKTQFVGPVPHGRVPALLRVADIAVALAAPSEEWEGRSPLKVFEYMASGRALIASGTEPVRDIIEDGCTGTLVTPGDEPEFQRALLSLASSQHRREQLGAQAARAARQEHSLEASAERLVAVYQSARSRVREAAGTA